MKGKGLLLMGVVCLALVVAALPFMAACAKVGSIPTPTPAPTPSPTPTPTPSPTPSPTPTPTETPEEFYKGKTIELIVPHGPGGGYDTVARLIAPYITKHTGADVIVRNKSGGGGLEGTNYLYEKAKRDGLTLELFYMGTPLLAQVVEKKEAHFDLTKFNFLANLGKSNQTLYINSKLPYESLSEMKASGKTFNFASSTMEANPGHIPAIVFADYGIGVNVVVGYKGTAAYVVSVLQGECDAAITSFFAGEAQYKEGNLRPLCVMTWERLSYEPDIPTLREAADFSAETKEWIDLMVGLLAWGHRPVITTPDVPADRVEFLKAAFKKVMEEKKLIGQLDTLRLDPVYMPGEEVEKIVKNWLEMPTDRVERFKQIILGK